MSIQDVSQVVINYGGLALIHGSVLALLTLLLSTTILRRSRPALQAALWTVVLVKFLLPPVLPGEMALSGWIGRAVTGATDAQPAGIESSDRPVAGQQIAESAQDSTAESLSGLAPRLIFISYLVVVTLIFVRTLYALRRTRRRIRALPLADNATRDEVLALAARINLKRPPDVRTTDEQITPYVFGFRRPFLVLPEQLMGMLYPLERHALVLHELAHLKRNDQLIRSLESLACAIFFFFPPVRWVCRRADKFAEMACDQWAIAISEVEPYQYAVALVRAVKQMRPLPQAQVELTFVPGVRLLEERLRTVLQSDEKKSPHVSASAKVVMMGWSLFVLAGGSAEQSHKESLDLPQMSAGKTEEVLSQGATAQRNESPVKLPYAQWKEDAKRGATLENPGEPPQPHNQEGQNKEKPRDLREERITTERRAIEAQAVQGSVPTPDGKQMSPYEEGFLLGKRYAEERAKWSQAGAVADGRMKRFPQSLDEKARREIEMRMQLLTTQPPRQ